MTITIRAKDAIKGLFILGLACLLTACGGSGGKSSSNSHTDGNTPSSVSSLAVSSVSSSSVIPAPSALSYSGSQVFKLNTAITALNASVTGTVTSYSVSPALPAGLTLNTTSGQITGTPTVVTSATHYTITATNSAGSTSFKLSIVVNGYVNLANFQEASVVIGHSDFVSSKIFLNASTLNQLNGNPFISDAGKLYIADTNFSRVLGYNNLPTVNGAAADFVVGQPDFTTITSAVTQAGMTLPTQVISSQGKFLVVGR